MRSRLPRHYYFIRFVYPPRCHFTLFTVYQQKGTSLRWVTCVSLLCPSGHMIVSAQTSCWCLWISRAKWPFGVRSKHKSTAQISTHEQAISWDRQPCSNYYQHPHTMMAKWYNASVTPFWVVQLVVLFSNCPFPLLVASTPLPPPIPCHVLHGRILSGPFGANERNLSRRARWTIVVVGKEGRTIIGPWGYTFIGSSRLLS